MDVSRPTKVREGSAESAGKSERRSVAVWEREDVGKADVSESNQKGIPLILRRLRRLRGKMKSERRSLIAQESGVGVRESGDVGMWSQEGVLLMGSSERWEYEVEARESGKSEKRSGIGVREGGVGARESGVGAGTSESRAVSKGFPLQSPPL